MVVMVAMAAATEVATEVVTMSHTATTGVIMAGTTCRTDITGATTDMEAALATVIE